MNSVDKQYQDLLKDILENGNVKKDRTGTGTKSIFGTHMKIDLRKGFPLLTTKKMFTKGIIYELLWFLKGDTNIKYLVDNGVNIWNDDAYRFYKDRINKHNILVREMNEFDKNDKYVDFYYNSYLDENKDLDVYETFNVDYFKELEVLTKDDFIQHVKDKKYITLLDDNSSFKIHTDINDLECIETGYDFGVIDFVFGDLGDVYGKQWRRFGRSETDQIQNIINTLKTNPDDRRMLCVAYNPDVINEVALPPCHVLFQFYTKELSNKERWELYYNKFKNEEVNTDNFAYPHLDIYGSTSSFQYNGEYDYLLDEEDIPTRELSCIWYQRSVDSFLGLPFNIASYALLTNMIAHVCNMSVGDLIFDGGDTHLYLNHLGQAKELISREILDSPTLYLNPKVRTINEFDFEDIKIENYVSQGVLKAPLSTGL